MKRVYINGIGALGPGIDDWAECAAVLRGECGYDAREYEAPKPTVMPRTILRRANNQIRLGVAVADEAVRHARVNANECAQVFASSEGDGKTEHQVCLDVSGDEPALSPILFHNSVHNAPAGNWAITVHNQRPSSSLGAYDFSFANGLLEAVCQVLVEDETVLFVCHDTKAPPVLNDLRPMLDSFGAAFVISAQPLEACLASISCEITPLSGQETSIEMPALEALRVSNPAARALPLLHFIANQRPGVIQLPYADHRELRVELAPC